MKAKPLGAKVWISVLVFGLFGQIAWIVENMYFNVFMDRTVTTNPFAVQMMVALSAIVSTLATLFAGTFSDRKGKRKIIVGIGYIVWGLTVMSFALISVKNTGAVFGLTGKSAILMTVALIVVMDCVMSLVGSVANDAAFNAWVTDVTDTTNRGKAEGVLAVMPILAMAAVFGGLDFLTQDTFRYTDGTTGSVFKEGAVKLSSGNWTLFFIILGTVVSAAGILGIVMMKDKKDLKPVEVSYKDIWYGFRPSVIKDNKILYLAYGAMALVGIANNSYLPYLIMYVERTLGIANYIIPVAVIIVLSGGLSVVFGILYDKFGRLKFLFPVYAAYIVGALMLFLFSPLVFKNGVPMVLIIIGGFILMGANLAISAILTATVRDYTPEDKVGQFQGVRMVFWVLIPMVIGPLLTAIITATGTPVGTDYYGSPIYEYPPYMFLVALGIMALDLPILILLFKKLKNGTNSEVCA